MPLQRYKLTISYRGTNYHGWQTQAANALWKGPKPPPGHGIPTIQEKVRRAVAKVVKHPVIVVGSSRTDAGVHAKGQIAHFDTDKGQIPTEGLRQSMNHLLPDDILIRSIEPVDHSFDAIWSTVSKRYQYVIWNSEDRPPLFADLVWHRWQPLDVQTMRAAAEYFLGEHDFSTFARAGHGRESAIRSVYSCTISQRGPRIVIGVVGNGFLWQMVRIMVGTMVDVGLGRWGPEVIPKMLEARDRRAGGPTAPPQGLFLQWIRTADLLNAQTQTRGEAELPQMDADESGCGIE
jgi:tRNA pseudouridine38-40 synthase